MIKKLGKTDIYLIDQLIRKRIHTESCILDAGCGKGRNSEYFIRYGFDIYGFDQNKKDIETLHQYAEAWNFQFDTSDNFKVGDMTNIPFPKAEFDFVICSAVLHFAKDRAQFLVWMKELIRVLKPKGILWFRMTAKHTIEHLSLHLHDDVYALPDGSTRYLLDRKVLENLMQEEGLEYLDPFKVVNVNDVRTMATIVLRKVDKN